MKKLVKLIGLVLLAWVILGVVSAAPFTLVDAGAAILGLALSLV
jgi:small-conductance mechanosensitive channel